MEIFDATCPSCGGGFYCDTLLTTLDVPLHCPYCDSYFEKPPGPTRGGPRKAIPLMGLKEGFRREVLYLPKPVLPQAPAEPVKAPATPMPAQSGPMPGERRPGEKA